MALTKATNSMIQGAVVNPIDYGADPTGVSDSTAAITAAITAAVAQNAVTVISNGLFSVTGISLPANAKLSFEGGQLVGRDTTTIITVAGNNVTIENPVIDLDSKSARGIFALSVDGFRLLGTTRISNAKTGEANYRGGVQIESCTNTVVGDVIGENIRQSATLAGLYRVLEFNLCTDFSTGKIFANNCDIALNLPDSVNGFVEAVQGNDITDNVVYLLGASRNISIGDVHGYICGEGIVFNCTDLDAGIHIGNVLINTASAKGLSLRTGGGYHLGSVTLIEANMEQNTSFSPATSRMTIGSLKIYQNTATAFKPINLFGNTHITFGTIDIQANAPLSLEGGRFTDCDRIIVGSARVWGIGGTALTIGLRFSDGGAPVADPYVTVRCYQSQNVTNPSIANTAVKTNISVQYDNVFQQANAPVSIVTATGMSIKLPTASTGLSSGMIWNNAGTITIV